MKVTIYELKKVMGSIALTEKGLQIQGSDGFKRFVASLYGNSKDPKIFLESLPNRLRSRVHAVKED